MSIWKSLCFSFFINRDMRMIFWVATMSSELPMVFQLWHGTQRLRSKERSLDLPKSQQSTFTEAKSKCQKHYPQLQQTAHAWATHLAAKNIFAHRSELFNKEKPCEGRFRAFLRETVCVGAFKFIWCRGKGGVIFPNTDIEGCEALFALLVTWR